MNTILNAAVQTPWWVYVLFIVLVNRGIAASRPQVVSLKKLVLLPLIFIVLSIHTMMTSFQVNGFIFSLWVFGIAIGSVVGWSLIKNHHYKVDKKNMLIQLPGSWITLSLILIIFISKYYFSYQLASDPALAHETPFEFSMLTITGICTGLFVGRLICYIQQVLIGKSIDLMSAKS